MKNLVKQQIKSFSYLLLLVAVLAFSLYGLYLDDGKAWFTTNKHIYLNRVYGRALTSGAGRNLASFKNDNEIFGEGPITEGSEEETGSLIMVPGDIIHFIFMISVDNMSDLSDSLLVLQGVVGDSSLRSDCSISAGGIRVYEVSVSVQTEENGTEKIIYNRGDYQNINNSFAASLATPENVDYIEIAVGETEISVGMIAEVGAYVGKYVYLVDIPIFYKDTGLDQGAHKYLPTGVPEGEMPQYGWMLIERCVFILS